MNEKELTNIINQLLDIAMIQAKQIGELKNELNSKPDIIFTSSRDLIEYRKLCQQ